MALISVQICFLQGKNYYALAAAMKLIKVINFTVEVKHRTDQEIKRNSKKEQDKLKQVHSLLKISGCAFS
jgi:hypothetical protein